MKYRAADELARSVGLELHNPDPDGPPVGAIGWEDDLTITHQDPEPGVVIARESALPLGIRVRFSASSEEI